MSDELSTKVSLDLDMGKVSKHLEDITSSVNDMLQGIEQAKTGLKELGPAGDKSLDDMSKSIGTLDKKLRALVNDLGNAHGDPEAQVSYKKELMDIYARLGDIERRMKTALSTDVVNDLMNAISKVNDVLGRVNLGKLEVSLKEARSGLSDIKDMLSGILPKVKEFVELMNSIDTSKLRGEAGASGGTDVRSSQVVNQLKEERKEARLTEEALESLKKARREAIVENARGRRDSAGTKTSLLKQFVSEPGYDFSAESAYDVKPFEDLIKGYRNVLAKMSEADRFSTAGKSIENIVSVLESMKTVLSTDLREKDFFNDIVPFGERAKAVISELSKLANGEVKNIPEFAANLKLAFENLREAAGITDGESAPFTNMKTFVSNMLDAVNGIGKIDRAEAGMLAGVESRTFDKYEKFLDKMETYTKKDISVQNTDSIKKELTEMDSFLDKVGRWEKDIGEGIQTDAWVKAKKVLLEYREELDKTLNPPAAKPIKVEDEVKKTGEEFDEVKGKAEQTGKVFAQMDDKLQESIDNMTAGIELMVAAMDQMNDKATHMVGVINRMFLQNDNKEFFGNAQAGIELLVESMDQLETQASQTQAELARIGGVNTGISEDAMKQLIEESKRTGRKQQSEREKTLNQLYTEQRARLREIYDLKKRMRKEEGDPVDQQKRIDALNESYSRVKVKMEGMANAAEKLRKLESYEKDLLGRNTFEQDKKIVIEVEQAVRSLVKAQNEYRAAEKNGDEEGKTQRQAEIEAAKRLIDEKTRGLDLDKMSLTHRERINKAIAESGAQQAKHNKQLELMKKSSDEINRYFQQMTQWFVQMMIINKLQEAWGSAVEYAKTYYDALNEIRVVTGMTQEEADALGESYRQMAQEMNLTSTQIAKSAVDIYRQGYASAEDVVGVSKGASVFGAITKMDTDKAMNTMTAALQNFQREGEGMEHLAFRIADSWSYLGDAVATEASDIGTAMSKVAGSATNVGLSLEQTSAWAAIVMAKTQESAETIGTSLNSMITRYTKLTAGGFNSIITDEDGEQVAYNDVAKALQKVGIATYTAAEGFRDYGVVVDELGAKWKNLSAAEQNYIAFQMAGTRNMNRFITLMNNYGEATTQTNNAMNSGGTAMAKYGVWMETVEAAQNNLQNSLEDLYALLLDGSAVKGFYNGLASIVDWFNAGTEAAGGMNILLPLVAGGIALVGVGVSALNAKLIETNGLLNLMKAHPVIAIISVVTAMIPVLTDVLGSLIETEDEAAKSTQKLSGELKSNRESIKSQADDIGSLEGKANPTAEEVDTLRNAISQLSSVAPDLAEKFGLDANAIDNFAASVANAKAALEEYLRTERYSAFKGAKEGAGEAEKAYANAFDALYGTGNNKVYGVTDAIDTVADAEKQIEWIEGMIADAEGKIRETLNMYEGLLGVTAEDILSRSMSSDDVAAIRDALIGDLPAAEGMIRSVFDRPDGVQSQKELIEDLNDELVVAQAKFEEIISGAKQQIQKAAQVAITEALNPETYNELSFSDFLDIEQFMSGLDYSDINWDEVQKLAKNIADKYQDVFKDSIQAANLNMALADELGMSEDIYSAMLADLTNPKLAELKPAFDQLFTPYIESWEQSKAEFAEAIGKDNVDDLIAKGVDTENLLGLIQNSLTGELPEGTTMQDVIDRILEFDPSNSDGLDHAGYIRQVFDDMGVETKESITDLEAILKAGNEAINEQIREIGKQKLANSGYKEMFEGLLGGKSLQEMSLALARDVLGDTATTEAVAAYAQEIVHAFIGENPKLAEAFDQQQGIIKEGLEGIVSILSNSDVRELLDELTDVTSSADARGIAGDVLTEGIGIQQAQDALEVLKTATKGTDEYAEALQTVADYVGIPVEALGDLGAAAEIINGDFDAFNEKLSEMLTLAVQTGDITVDENGKIHAASEETEFLAEMLRLVLECCNLELSDDSFLVTLNDLTSETADNMSRLAELAGQIREEETDNRADQTGYRDYLDQMKELGAEGAASYFNENVGKNIQDALAQEYPELIKLLADVEAGQIDVEEASKKFGREIEKAIDRSTMRNFEKTGDALRDLEKNAISVEDAADTLQGEMDDLADAAEAFTTLTDKGFTDDTVDELQTLADYLGITKEQLQNNWDASAISNALQQAANEGQSALQALQDAAIIEFVLNGHSNVDLSQAQNALMTVESLGEAAVKRLLDCGLFELDYIDAGAEAAIFHPTAWDVFGNVIDGYFTKATATTRTAVVKPKGENPLGTGANRSRSSGSTGGSGGGSKGGGSGSGSTKVSKKTQGTLDEISKVKELYDYRLELVDLAKEYYEATGELEGVKAYTEQEIEIRKDQAEALKDYTEKLKTMVAEQEAIMSGNKSGSKKYKQAQADLEALKEELEATTKEFAEAEIAIIQMTKAFEELEEEQRQKTIAVEEMIREVLEKEEELQRDMLAGRKEMEDEILAILEERYEKEHELQIEAMEDAIEAAEAKKEAIEAEIDALDEALAKRKELAELAEDEEELAELEAKYARIAADPTRAREALEIYEQIQQKREDMAWNAADKEVENQKDALQQESDKIDDAISDMEDQMDEIDEYYEKLFENPQQLIAEMEEIMKKSDSEILAWLKANSEQFAKNSATTQETMLQEWQDTLNQMRGYTETYNTQIKEIMSWTDTEILQWMQQHDVDFKNATETQQQSFLNGWKNTLEEWRNAYAQTQQQIIDLTNKTPIDTGKSNNNSNNGSSSSGASSGVGNTTPNLDKVVNSVVTGAVISGQTTSQKFVQKGTKTATTSGSGKDANTISWNGKKYVQASDGNWYLYDDRTEQKVSPYRWSWYSKPYYVKQYNKGGIADYTGMAWLDGTKSKPERVLSWKQNALFENLVKTLERMSDIRIPVPQFTMPAFGDAFKNRSEGNVTIENVTVHVEKLESDADYELMADKVGEVIGKRLVKGKAIGGIRIK